MSWEGLRERFEESEKRKKQRGTRPASVREGSRAHAMLRMVEHNAEHTPGDRGVHVATLEDKAAARALEKKGLVTIERTNERIAGLREWYVKLRKPGSRRSAPRPRAKKQRVEAPRATGSSFLRVVPLERIERGWDVFVRVSSNKRGGKERWEHYRNVDGLEMFQGYVSSAKARGRR